ncbi:MAG: PD-(D/E)XK nuclease-like domain-containing protein [Verrucomicrobiota bacterium]
MKILNMEPTKAEPVNAPEAVNPIANDPKPLLDPFFEQRPSRIMPDMDFEVYKNLPAANASMLKKPTAKEMLHSLIGPNIPTPAMMGGTLTHTAVFEPNLFDTDKWKEQYQVFTATKTLDSKAALAALALDPRPLITPDMLDTARRSRDAVWNHKEACRLLLETGKCEVSAEAWDADMGCMRKVRIDRLPDDPAVGVVDLKTTSGSLLLRPFVSECFKYSYGLQLAFYMDTLAMIEAKPRETAWIIAVNKEAPFMARVFEMNQALPEVSLIVRGRDIYQERLASFVLSYHESRWDGYENEQPSPILTA